MVFPSLTDTFGLVQVESTACGTPVAAYHVDGPKEALIEGVTGCMNDDLMIAINDALKLDRHICSKAARLKYSWFAATDQFLDNIKKHSNN